MNKIIHVNQAVIARNRKNGTNEPPLIVRTYRGAVRARELHIMGPSVLRHQPNKPLRCGARVWIETTAEVMADGYNVDELFE